MNTERIQNAIDFIELNLTNALSPKSIASKVNWSEWHFQRIFHSTVGLTLKSYIRKRRLHEAAKRISFSSRGLLEIAIEFGFESQETFSRAFKREFSFNPGEFRKNKSSKKPYFRHIKVTQQYLEHLHEGKSIAPKYIDIEAMNLVGKTTKFVCILSKDSNSFRNIASCWDCYELAKTKLRPINQQEWGVVDTLTSSEKIQSQEFWYMAGCETKTKKLPEGCESKYIPAGRYAVFTHKGRLDKIKKIYEYIFGHWIHSTKAVYREAPELELYDERFNVNSERSEMDIYVPIY